MTKIWRNNLRMPSGTFCTVITLGVSYSKKADMQLSMQKLRLALSDDEVWWWWLFSLLRFIIFYARNVINSNEQTENIRKKYGICTYVRTLAFR